MSEAASTFGPFAADDGDPAGGGPDPGQLPGPDPAAGDGTGELSSPGLWPGEGRACLSEDDLLAVLDGLGVAGTHDPEEDQDAIAEAEWQARQAYESGVGDDDATDGQGSTDGQDGGHDGAGVSQGRGDDGEGRAVSPVLIGEHLLGRARAGRDPGPGPAR